MESTNLSSRRAFVLGGAAAACAVPLASARLAGGSPAPSRAAGAGAAAASEVAQWEALVGTRFLIDGALATLALVERPAADPKRPAALARFQPFTAWFEMEARLAPAGQQTYRIVDPGKRATELFLSRGNDRRGKAVLYALFN